MKIVCNCGASFSVEPSGDAEASDEAPGKYECIRRLVLEKVDIGTIAFVLYGREGEREKNRVYAAVAHLKTRGRLP